MFTCIGCNDEKPINQFSKSKNVKRGHFARCKECTNDRSRERHEERHSGECADCGVEFPYLQEAHIVARHKGGTKDRDNIILICPNCHILRDRAEKSEYSKRAWTPERRAAHAELMAKRCSDPEAEQIRIAKMVATRTGKKYPLISEAKRGIKRGPQTEEHKAKIAAGIKAAIAAKSSEERAAWNQSVSEAKKAKGGQGNMDNLRKGWTPEVQGRAREASVIARRNRKEAK